MRHWISKFRNAFRGVRLAMAGQSSFYVHLPMAGLVIALGIYLECSHWQWCILALCIALVITLEIINSAIETLAHALCPDHHPAVGKALDMASAAVLIASLIASAIGLTIFSTQLLTKL